jgi:hypothetical protein
MRILSQVAVPTELPEAQARWESAAAEFQRVLEEKRLSGSASQETLDEILIARFEEAGALSDYLEILRASWRSEPTDQPDVSPSNDECADNHREADRGELRRPYVQTFR